MTALTYYTVLIGKRSCLVTYAESPAYKVQALVGPFPDPGEASQQIKHSLQGHMEYLAPGVFQRKVSNLAQRYQQDLVKLTAWSQGKAIPGNQEGNKRVLTNEQFFSLLSESGLDLAEEYLEQDLKTLQENHLPVSDTVASLLTVHALLEEEREEEEPL
jgi:hypothetical protein